MKCPICGNDEFLDTTKDFLESPSDKIRFHHYACSKCGYSIIVDDKIPRVNAATVEYKKLEKQLEDVKKELNGLEVKFGINKIREKIASLEEESKSLDITIRRKQEIEAEIKKLYSTPVKGYKETRSKLVHKKNDLEYKIKHFNAPHGSIYKKVKI